MIDAAPQIRPHQDSITTLYDRVLQQMIEVALATAPTTTSYSRDVYPILQRAHDRRWVEGTSAPTRGPTRSPTRPVIDAIVAGSPTHRGGHAGPQPSGRQHGHSNADCAHAPLEVRQYTRTGPGAEPSADVTPDGIDRAALTRA